MSPLTAQQCIAAFIKKLSALDREKSVNEKFRDFCELCFCAKAKRMAQTKERADELEDRYMQIVGSYRDKDTVRAYPELLALAACGVQQGCDFLGSVATQMEALSTDLGQFFTPYEAARMMAAMTLGDAGELISRNGFLTVQEPASGAGGMVLAAAQELEAQGFNARLHMLVHATDLSALCFHMTYLQLSLRGIPALVTHGNSLTLETFARAWTPPTMAFYDHHGRLFPEPMPETAKHEDEPVTLFGEQLVLL